MDRRVSGVALEREAAENLNGPNKNGNEELISRDKARRVPDKRSGKLDLFGITSEKNIGMEGELENYPRLQGGEKRG